MKYQYSLKLVDVGCDEAGRGCLAGPVYAAAVVLDPAQRIRGLRDSKKLSAKARSDLRKEIESKALAYAVQSCSVEEIDQYNIANASYYAMHKALDRLTNDFDLILVDGHRFIPYKFRPHVCIIGGDDKYASIAAASILAKTHRDEHMLSLSAQFPEYGWEQNVGYPTQLHRTALQNHGPCIHHRQSFKLIQT